VTARFTKVVSDEQQIAALREEIRLTARMMADLQRRHLRPRIIWSGVGAAVVGSLVALMIHRPNYLVVLVFAHAFAFPMIAGIVGIAVHAEAMSQLAAQHHARRQRLVERFHLLPSDQVAAALRSLRSDAEADVRELAKRLLREVDLRTELAPAVASEGFGNEPASTLWELSMPQGSRG
jgi:hypothetical protein